MNASNNSQKLARTWIISYNPSRLDVCQTLMMLQLVTPFVGARMCEALAWEREIRVLILPVYMWWDISLSLKTAPQNWFSPGCQKGHKNTHTYIHTYTADVLCSLFEHAEALKCVFLCARVWLKVWPLSATVSLKRSSSNQSTAANIRGELKSRNRETHTQSDREDSMRQRQSGLTEKRRERLRLRHTAETGIKELESKERIKEGEWNLFSVVFF